MDSSSRSVRWKILAVLLSISLVIGLCPGLSKVSYAEELATDSQATNVQEQAEGTTGGADEATADGEATADSEQQADSQGTVEEQEGTIEMPTVVDQADDSAATASDEATTAEDTASDEITGDTEITKGGTYQLASDASGVITVSTTDPVTFVGGGLTVTYGEDGQATLTGTSINVAFDASGTEGADITLKDAYLSNKTELRNTFNFAGEGNKLSFEGVNVVDYDKGYTTADDALIHVPSSAELTILGSGTAYIYNNTQGAGIGGNTGESNGTIVFGDAETSTGPTIFEKGTRQGAVIGAGARSKDTDIPGSITFEGGLYNLISNSRGAVIGGSAGANGASAGTKVYIKGGSININVDWTGAAIGGGGFDSGNDSSGGECYITGGSLRIYADHNAVANNPNYKGWNGQSLVEGVSDVALTAKRLNANDEEVVRCNFDTSLIDAATNYTAYVDGSTKPFFSGPLHGYSFIQEALDKGEQLSITETPSNWVKSTDQNLYFYLTKKDHKLKVNGQRFIAKWDETNQTFNIVDDDSNLVSEATGNGSVLVAAGEGEAGEAVTAKAGDTVTVTPTAADGNYLAQVRYAVKAEGEENYSTYTALKATDGTYTFTMPEGNVLVYADFVSIVWDGTLDLTWYDPDQTVYHLNYAAQFEAAAALNNGIFTTYPTKTVTPEGSTASHEVPDYEKYLEMIGAVQNEDDTFDGSNLYGEFTSTYTVVDMQVSTTTESEVTNTTRVIGDATQIVANNSTGTHGQYNQVTTSTYWYGATDFNGKTIYVDSDLDFGGTKTADGKWSPTSPLYMSLAGQYAMLPQNGWSVLGSSFNGCLDGNGHKFENVYAERYAKGGNFGDSQSLGIVGRLGNHDGDPAEIAAVNPTVRQIVLESGWMSCRRSSGCIVGKIGQTSATKKNDGSTGGIIEYCINKADIICTDKKGIGGICGAGWNKGVIRYCANFGNVTQVGSGSGFIAGGIVGSNEVPVIGCYNVGYVYAGQARYSQAIGTNNGSCSWTNCFYLKGSTNNTSASPNDGVYRGTINNVKAFGTGGDVESLQSWMVNGGTSSDDTGAKIWFNDTTGINSKDGVSYPVLYYQGGKDVSSDYDVYVLQSTTNGKVSADKETAKYGETVTMSYETLAPGYTFDYYIVNGEKTTNPTVTVTGGTMISAKWRELTSATFTIEDTTDKPYEITVTKTGVDKVDGVWKYVTDQPVKSGDTVYEEDVLTYTAKIKDGYVPEDSSSEYTGVFSFQTNNEGKRVSSSSTFTVTKDHTNLDLAVSSVGEAKKTWYSKADTSWYSADKDEFEISTPEQLAGVAKLVYDYTMVDGVVTQGDNFYGKTIKLASDISLKNNDGTDGLRQWCPIGGTGSTSKGNVFEGTFDGAGHSITDLVEQDYISGVVTSYRGLFGQTMNATIKNVNVAGSISTSSYNGGIAAYAINTTVDNCVSNVNMIPLNTWTYGTIGGVVGYGKSANVTNCVNNGSINCYMSYSYVAGIIAKNEMNTGDTERKTIANCVNNGAITVLDGQANSGSVAGIITVANKYTDISNCINAADITAYNAASRRINIGGIVQEVANGTTISECANTGNLSNLVGTGSKGNGCGDVGGICGNFSGGGTMTDCYNQGNLVSEYNKQYNECYVGGLVGRCSGTSAGSITNCYNSGTAKAELEGYYGALAPNAYKVPTVTNCYYLDSTGTSGGSKTDDTYEGAKALTSDELKAAAPDLGEKFSADPNGGYPILASGTTLPVTVSFNTGDGSFVPAQSVTSGSTITRPADPTKDDYVFVGWYTDEACTQEYDFSTAVDHNFTLYAKWQRAYNLQRLSGDDAYGTNLETLKKDVEENGTPSGVIICNTGHYIDSLSAAALSGLLDYPILLVNGTDSTLNDNSKQAINLLTNSGNDKIEVIILGGKFAVTESIEAELQNYDSDDSCERIYGDDGYLTNQAVYDYGANRNGGWNEDEVMVATGNGFYDALGAGSYAAAKKSFILLSNPSSDNASLVEKAANHKAATIIGGKAAVTDELVKSIEDKGLTTERIAGDDAYATKVAFVKHAIDNGMTLEGAGFSTINSYYDALGSSHILAKSNSVMFLVGLDETFNQPVYNMMGSSEDELTNGKLFGGTAAVTDVTKQAIIDAVYGK
ncbi:MAG: cell wall-binding repeat-containing protein [Phoenicibacter congonensis]|uniref:Cell wall-binding repeat-containing protein n=1 Tax=Phoenicibacter congonensis TaxID=1944646 RepID=A0AA43RGY1_9ACTN|nr:cell wall-binding repeat-containing protein [Phoenicibacter congonensis]